MTNSLDLPTLDQLRKELADGLGAAIHRSAPSALSEQEAAAAAEQGLEGHDLPQAVRDLFDAAPLCTLVCFDADSIQSWVFASERVQVAAGASMVLDELNESVARFRRKKNGERQASLLDEVEGLCGVLYSAGGGGILFADARRPSEELTRAVKAALEKQSHGLTFTVVAESLFARDFEASSPAEPLAGAPHGLHRFAPVGGFQAALVRAQVRLQAAKDARGSDLSAEGDEASGDDTRKGNPPGRLKSERCPSCNAPLPDGKTARDDGPGSWCERCLKLRRALRGQKGEHFEDAKGNALTFSDLAETAARSRQYLAFLALDGNSMGNVVRGVRTFLQLRAFSEATSRIYEAARRGLREVLAPYLDSKASPEGSSLSLLGGGDEITLVLPAAAAPAAALALIETVEEGFDQAASAEQGGLLYRAFESSPKQLEALRRAGVGAGLVMAAHKYPVRLLRLYAGDLQKAAKRRCASKGLRSGIAWTLLTESGALTEKLHQEEASEDLGAASFRSLLEEVRQAHEMGVPQSALQTVLSYRAREGLGLRSLEKENGGQVLDLLTAHFFRYQLARNDKLQQWWTGITGAEPSPDSVDGWFKGGKGARRLEQILDLLSLRPFPKATARAQEDAA